MKLPQLTLRDLFWLVALVAMGCGWWVERQALAARVTERDRWKYKAEKMIELWESEGGTVEFGEPGESFSLWYKRPCQEPDDGDPFSERRID